MTAWLTGRCSIDSLCSTSCILSSCTSGSAYYALRIGSTLSHRASGHDRNHPLQAHGAAGEAEQPQHTCQLFFGKDEMVVVVKLPKNLSPQQRAEYNAACGQCMQHLLTRPTAQSSTSYQVRELNEEFEVRLTLRGSAIDCLPLLSEMKQHANANSSRPAPFTSKQHPHAERESNQGSEDEGTKHVSFELPAPIWALVGLVLMIGNQPQCSIALHWGCLEALLATLRCLGIPSWYGL